MKATVSYAGGGFHGFAVNNDVRTVAGELEAALKTITSQTVVVTCAGRTDKGVHGRGQVISFEVPDGITPYRIERSVNGLCRPLIAIRDTQIVEDEFHARFSATWRQYRYRILPTPTPDPLLHGLAWHVRKKVDRDQLDQAAVDIVGEHDFTSFCRRPKVGDDAPDKSLIRNVYEAEWRPGQDNTLEFWIRAGSFCHQMVRSLVGTSVDISTGRFEPNSMATMLAAKDRSITGQLAPPQGLTLWEVGYS